MVISPSGEDGTPARRGLTYLILFFALRALIYRLAGDWDACAPRSKAGPVMGLRPLLGPPCIPRSTHKENFQIPQNGEGTRLELRELPSLAALGQAISLRAA